MAVGQDVIAAARQVEAEEGVAAATLLAVALVETGARPFAAVGARAEPLIRFEGHYFDRLLPEAQRRIARTAGLSHPKAGAVKNPAGQEARWRLLERAASLDREAAYASTSWGLGQVMGSHFQMLGLAGAEALSALARTSAAGQLTLVARFLRAGRLDALAAAGEFEAFARRYNGPGFRRNRYDAKIAAAHAEARRVLGEGAAASLAVGARGAAVADLQRRLTEAGFPLAPDGIFGPATRAAVLAFQRRTGLVASGAAGAGLLARLVAAGRSGAGETAANGWSREGGDLSAGRHA